ANWDLCNMASVMAIGILTDNAAKYDQAVTYFTRYPMSATRVSTFHSCVTQNTIGVLWPKKRSQGINLSRFFVPRAQHGRCGAHQLEG
ncbi:hypothetical protein ABT116_49360, partial [Streptomyces sp. NPDC002130]|uniref:hypothetical protein n=1 Tax=Streptomyces sp. NPDC002130 TaxID=3155568 RepID=UPI0033282C73